MEAEPVYCLLCGAELTLLKGAVIRNGTPTPYNLWIASNATDASCECPLTGGPHNPDKEV